MRLATWNVRTMRTGLPDTCGGSGCAEDLRKTAVIDGELKRLNIAIAALQETRLPDQGSIKEANYTFYWVGKEYSSAREHGVGFAIRNDLIPSLEPPQGISERLMVVRLASNSGFVTIISAYAPTLASSTEAKDQFYNQLTETVRKVRLSDRLIILGDFNARVGQDRSAWPNSLGDHGVGKLNENGQRLLEFCSNYQMCVTNTYFKGKFSHRVSWRHPRSGHWHQLDLVLTKKDYLCETLHTRTFQSAECDTDHSLVVTRIKIYPKKVHSSRPPGLKRINVMSTGDNDKVEAFAQLVQAETSGWQDDAPLDVEWENVKHLLTVTAAKAFGYRDSKTQDWFTENIEHLQPLLDAKRQAALNYRTTANSNTLSQLKKAKAELQRSARYYANAYWENLCRTIQSCASLGNFGGVFSSIKQALGPTPKRTALLKESDGTIITQNGRQLERWVEHYTGLYSQPINISSKAVDLIPKLATLRELDDMPTIMDFHKAVGQLKCRKSPGSDNICSEIIKVKCVYPVLYNLLGKCWLAGTVPQDMRNANIVTLYKGKGDRGDCNCYRGISLLSIVGKLLGRLVLSKLQILADRVYPESQCGFRAGRSTVDIIFTLRQIQEKCREQNVPVFIAFVDLNKAFDTVSREGLYTALENIGCPPNLLNLVKSFHEDMKGTVVYDGCTSEPFPVRRGVRQGCVLAPTLFGLFFSLLLKAAFGDNQSGIHLHTRKDGKLFNLSHLRSKRFCDDAYVDTLLFADDAAFVASSLYELQSMVNDFSKACNLFSMSINVKKTVVLAQGCVEKPVVTLDGTPLEVVDSFCYLGSTVTNNLSLDKEIDIRIGKASSMFGRLRTRVWDNKHLTVRTRILVYQACVLSILLYGAECWTSYAKQERRLNAFHMRCLRSILHLSWEDKVTNERVLDIVQMPSFTALLKERRLRWLGHVHRMEESRLPRRVMLGEIANAKRAIGRPLLRFKDCAKRDMTSFNITHSNWEELADDRPGWRKSLKDGQKHHDQTWFASLADRRARRHASDTDPSVAKFNCANCGRAVRSRIGLYSHQRKCLPRPGAGTT